MAPKAKRQCKGKEPVGGEAQRVPPSYDEDDTDEHARELVQRAPRAALETFIAQVRKPDRPSYKSGHIVVARFERCPKQAPCTVLGALSPRPSALRHQRDSLFFVRYIRRRCT
jgi:hypothetical protein